MSSGNKLGKFIPLVKIQIMGINVRILEALFLNFFSLFVQSLAWLQTLKNTFIYKSTYLLKFFAVTQHFSYSFKHNCFVYTKN